MTNLKLLEDKKKHRDGMLNFLLSGEEIEFSKALELNNEIALTSNKISAMEKFSYPKLQEDANEWYLEVPSTMNIQ